MQLYRNRSVCGRWLPLLTAAVVCLSSLATSPVHATPIYQWRCLVTLPQGPLPTDSLEFFYNIRRHAHHGEPVEELSTEIWSQGIFEDNGEWELDVFLISGEMFTETSSDSRTALTDGMGVVADQIEDEAKSTSGSVVVEGFIVDEIDVALRKDDGSAWDTHLEYPQNLDPANFDNAECVIAWLVPNGGVICQVQGGGSTLCTHGWHRGILTSFEELPHEHEHNGGGFTINQGVNDAWVSDGAPFQGLFFTVYEDLGIFFLSWFTFDTESAQALASIRSQGEAGSNSVSKSMAAMFGADDQRWVTASGTIEGDTATLKAERTTGGAFNSSEPLATQDPDYGDITVKFNHCNEAVLSYNFPGPGLSGQMTLARVLDDNVSVCEALSGD